VILFKVILETIFQLSDAFLLQKFAYRAIRVSFLAMADFDAHDKDRSVSLHSVFTVRLL